MPDLSWRDAIIRVLQGRSEPMHYTDIADAIAEQELRSAVGATPANTVNAVISLSRQNEGTSSPFQRASRGFYSLRSTTQLADAQPTEGADDELDDTGLIKAFGMYWARNKVLWTANPRILGQQQAGSIDVNFCSQQGVYLLHDARTVVYVGRTTEQSLGVRLRQHVNDRLNGRWDRFSWFGIYPVADSGDLDTTAAGSYTSDSLIATMEALLIEGLEPPQNRKRGDDFRAVEFLQVEDHELERKQLKEILEEAMNRL